MLFLYGILIRFYHGALAGLSPFHWKAKEFVSFRKNWSSIIRAALDPRRKTVLFLCPSIGEFQECRSFVERMSKEKSEHQFVFAFFSPSGYTQAKIPREDSIRTMIPMDTRKNAEKFLGIVRPEEIFILATGLWPNLTLEAKRKNIPQYFISFQGWKHSSLLSKRLAFFYRPLFRSLDIVFTYNEDSKKRIIENFGDMDIETCGNLRFDSISGMKEGLRQIKGIEKFVNGKFCFVAGSTEKKEDEILIEAFKAMKDMDMKWIIVPHEKRPATLEKLKNGFGADASFYSRNFDPDKKVLVYDITGDLFHLYQYADVCLVGRGFERTQIHNMIEPLVFGKPVLIGPEHKRFYEPCLFIREKLAFEFNNTNEFIHLMKKLFAKELQIDSGRMEKLFREHCGGTKKIMEKLSEKNKDRSQQLLRH